MKYSYAPISVSKPWRNDRALFTIDSKKKGKKKKKRETLFHPVVFLHLGETSARKWSIFDLLWSEFSNLYEIVRSCVPSTNAANFNGAGSFSRVSLVKSPTLPWTPASSAFRQRSLVIPRAGRSRFYARIAFQVMLIRKEPRTPTSRPSSPLSPPHPSRAHFHTANFSTREKYCSRIERIHNSTRGRRRSTAVFAWMGPTGHQMTILCRLLRGGRENTLNRDSSSYGGRRRRSQE